MIDSEPVLPNRYRMLGSHVDSMTIPDMHALIGHAVATRQRLTMVSQNVHSIYTLHHDPDLRAMQQSATFVRIDGMPIIVIGRLLGYPLEARHRTGWMDWLDPFMTEAGMRGWRLFYLGSRPDAAALGEARLRERYPDVHLTVHHGHFDMEPAGADVEAVLAVIADAQPDVLIVGMGMPRQEAFLRRFGERITAPVRLTSGAALDYVAGVIPTPPRWLGRLGVEWLYRLLSEPRRLWRRYLVEPWFVFRLAIRDLIWRPDRSRT